MMRPRSARAHGDWTSPVRARHARALATAIVVGAALAAAGCGGSSNDSSSTSTAASSPAAAASKLAQFSQCMRAHGVSDFPDPVNGTLSLRVEKGTDMDPNSSRFQSAEKACKSLEPAGLLRGSNQSAGQQTQLLKFVDCMHKHGVSNFPDPDQSGHMVLSGKDFDPDSPQFTSAMQACRSLIPGGGTAVGG